MDEVKITVSDSADYDMFRKIKEPSPEAEHYFNSPLGKAVCEDCERSWVCHRRAWGSVGGKSRCNLCGGTVTFQLKEQNEDHNQ